MNNGAKVIRVIETTLSRRGNGNNDPIRLITQYWSLKGKLLAEVDPVPSIPFVVYVMPGESVEQAIERGEHELEKLKQA